MVEANSIIDFLPPNQSVTSTCLHHLQIMLEITLAALLKHQVRLPANRKSTPHPSLAARRATLSRIYKHFTADKSIWKEFTEHG